MANIARANTMLQRMALTADAATEVTSADGQGMSSIEDFAQMDKDGIE